MKPVATPAENEIRIRDPIHGTLRLSRAEISLIDSPVYQRLRMIKQLGLADLAFPGATHTRYAHGLGTMHIASAMFDRITAGYEPRDPDRLRLRQTVRLAALFHDLGHAPLSHTTEAFMPPVRALELGEWQSGPADRQASHEDYTLKMVVDSELSTLLAKRVTEETGVEASDVAALIAGTLPAGKSNRFRVGGLDWFPALRSCVSSELDADRMDYLLRDSYYAGVPYGSYDHEWLLENLMPVELDGTVHLGLGSRASFSFEDFLLSRYHMFTSVYFHQIPIGYEVMLRRYKEECADELMVPSDPQLYLHFDDIYLWNALRRSKNAWAQRIVERRAFRMLREVKAFPDDNEPRPAELDTLKAALDDSGIEAVVHNAKGELSKYFRASPDSQMSPALFIVDGGQVVPMDQYSRLYQRYAAAVVLQRIYVDPDRVSEAKAIAEGLN